MLRRWLRFRVLLPAVLLAGAAILLYRCGPEGDHAGPGHSVRERKPAPPPAVPDVQQWARSFSRQLPPPAELQPDPELTSGTLANGLRYLILERPEGEGVSFRLLVQAGAVHEREEERGFAHFVEHMAFRGTTRFPQGDLLAVFERLGLKAGTHANAFTAPDCTVWKLDVPLPDELTLTTALHFLRDVTDGILFRTPDTDQEREVVLRELEERHGKVDARQQRVAAIFPSVPAAVRPVIGARETLRSATAAAMRAFWQREYVPGRMVVIAAGDLTRAEMLQRLRSHFESLPARVAPPEPAEGDPLAGEGAYIACLTDPARGQTRISMAAPQPPRDMGDDPARRRENLARQVSLLMLTERLDRLSARSRTQAYWQDGEVEALTPRIHWLEAGGTVKPEHWREALAFLVREWRRAVEHGFDDLEFHAARESLRRDARRTYSRRLMRGTASAADKLVESVRQASVYEAPEVALNRSMSILESLSLAECETVLRSDWSHRVLRILIEGKEVEPLADEAQRILHSAWAGSPEGKPNYMPPRPLETRVPGPPGKVLSRSLDAGRQLLKVEFANGVRAYLKPLPGLGGSVTVTVHGGYGSLSLPPKDPALRHAAELLTYWHPLPGWHATEFRAALNLDGAGATFVVGDSSFTWNGETGRDRLSRQLEVMCACIHSPGIDRVTEEWTPTGRDIAWHDARKEGSGLQSAMRRVLCGGDGRGDPYPPGFENAAGSRTLAWLRPALRNCRLCVMIAGDFAPDTAITALENTFGALPRRSPWDMPPPFPGMPAPVPGIHKLKIQSPSARVVLALPFAPAVSAEGTIHVHLLAALMELRMRDLFRSRLAASYAPSITFWKSPDQTRHWLLCQVNCDTARLEDISAELRRLMGNLSGGKWTADEYQRAARPLSPWLGALLRDPELWTRMPDQVDVMPPQPMLQAGLDGRREDAVKQLAARMCQPDAGCEFLVIPGDE